MKFYSFHHDTSQLLCEACTRKMFQDTQDGTLVGDERVTADMVFRAGSHGQCDNCLEQCDDYPDCEGQ